MKIAYCRQVPCEDQESPLMLMGDYPLDIVVVGNRDFNSHTNQMYDDIDKYWSEALDRVEDVLDESDEVSYKSVREVIEDYFPHASSRGDYSDDDIKSWQETLDFMYETCCTSESDKAFAMAMSLITGHTWETGTIRGCCQRDWQHIIYDSNVYIDSDIERFEAEYFNTGSEWYVYVTDDSEVVTLDNLDDIVGFYQYTTDYDEARELKRTLEVDKVVMWRPHAVHSYEYEMEEE